MFFFNRFTQFRYPKFALLILTIIGAYLLFAGSTFDPWHAYVVSLGYGGIFFLGMLYSYSFTAAPATALLLVIAPNYTWWFAGMVAGAGALVSDTLILRFIRHSFLDEIERIAQWRPFLYFRSKMSWFIRRYCLPVLGAVVIGSPLPDELGVTLLASSSISDRAFYILSYVLNTCGILGILWLGTQLQ